MNNQKTQKPDGVSQPVEQPGIMAGGIMLKQDYIQTQHLKKPPADYI